MRLTCSIMLWGGRNTANKYHWHVWEVLAVSRPHWVCSHSWRVCFPSLHCSGFRLLSREWALGCVHFPGLSCSGSGSWVLHKGTDLVGHAFCVLPRFEQLRQPGTWRSHSPQVGGASYHLPIPSPSVSWVRCRGAISVVPCVSSGELISPRCQPSRIPGRLG